MARRKAPRPEGKTPAGRTALPDVQTPYQILKEVRSRSVTEKQLRSEYTRLRDRAQKQLKRLAASEYGVPEKWAAEAARGGFWKLGQLRDVREIAFAMSSLQEFINAPTASVSGRTKIAKETISTLHEHGYTGINKKNLAQFGRFMDKMRDRMGGRKAYPSGDLAQFFSDSKTQGTRIPVKDSELMEAFTAWQAVNEL